MSKIQMLKTLVNERLTAAAEEVFEIFESTVEGYEGEVFCAKEEIDRQRKLLEGRADLLRLPVCEEEEVHAEQQERSPSPGWRSQEEPEPPQIKEELFQQREEASGFTLQLLKCEIKEEQEELFQQQEEDAASSRVTLQPLKCEDEEHNTQWSQLGQTLKEEHGEGDPLPCTSRDQLNTDPDGENWGVLEPDRENWGVSEPDGEDCRVSEPDGEDCRVSEPAREGRLLSPDWSGTEMEDSGDDYDKVNERLSMAAREICGIIKRTITEYQGDLFRAKQKINHQRRLLDLVLKPVTKLHRADNPVCEEEVHPSDIEAARDDQLLSSEGSTTETENSDDYCKETREPQPGLNSLKSKKTQEGRRSSPSKKLKTSTESSHEVKSTYDIPSTSCCKVCRESFPNIVSLMRHVIVHSKQCGFCEKRLEPTELLVHHLQLHRKCDVCGKGFPSDKQLEVHFRIHTGEKPFGCSECGKTFNHKGSLTKHMVTHPGMKPIKCSICNKGCGSKSELKTHMSSHIGEKPISCSVCKKSFRWRSELKMHIRSHTGEKPFKCSVCNKACGSKSHLKIHMMVHTGEKPFSCSVCKKSFQMKSHLKRHMISHTGEKPFSCSVCKKSFGMKSSLKTHMIVHTGEKPFSCSVCQKSFRRKSHLKIHMSSVSIVPPAAGGPNRALGP